MTAVTNFYVIYASHGLILASAWLAKAERSLLRTRARADGGRE